MKKNYQTRCKDNIMAYLKSREDRSFTVYDVYSYLENNGVSVNLTTVYRNLDKLAHNGLLMKIKNAEQDCCKYQYVRPNGSCHEHIHMQCRECGKIYHLECSFMIDISKHLLEHHNFSLESSDSMLSGLCEACN